MTHTQNVEAIIAQLIREKQRLATAYEEAEEQNRHLYNRVLVWEEAYIASGKSEAVGRTLDEVYKEYSEANEAMCEAEEKLEAIKEAIEALRKGVEAIRWMGL